MPFKSVAQRNFMHAKHPGIAKRFEEETPKGAKLPYHASKGGDTPLSKMFGSKKGK